MDVDGKVTVETKTARRWLIAMFAVVIATGSLLVPRTLRSDALLHVFLLSLGCFWFALSKSVPTKRLRWGAEGFYENGALWIPRDAVVAWGNGSLKTLWETYYFTFPRLDTPAVPDLPIHELPIHRFRFQGDRPSPGLAIAAAILTLWTIAAPFVWPNVLGALTCAVGAMLLAWVIARIRRGTRVAATSRGLCVFHGTSREFVSLQDIVRVFCESPTSDRLGRVTLRKVNGSRIHLFHNGAETQRLVEFLNAHLPKSEPNPDAAHIQRNHRPTDEWVRALESRVRVAGPQYRIAPLETEPLWRIVEDPTAPDDARAGAALVLLRSKDDGARERLTAIAQSEALRGSDEGSALAEALDAILASDGDLATKLERLSSD
jgi:hypothetical protein